MADLATFRASGNVIFSAAGERADEIVARVEAGLEGSLGYEVPVFLRSAAEVVEIAAQVPFDPQLVAASAGRLQVSMLREAPAAKAAEQVLALASEEDRLAIHGRELYWLPSGGILDFRLDMAAIDIRPGTHDNSHQGHGRPARRQAPPKVGLSSSRCGARPLGPSGLEVSLRRG